MPDKTQVNEPGCSKDLSEQAIEDDLLNELQQEFETNIDIGPPIKPKLAGIVNAVFRTKMSDERSKELLSKYKIPENCDQVSTPKINVEIWNKLKPATRSLDIKFQTTAQKLNKATVPMLNACEELLELKSNPKYKGDSELQSAIRHIMDSVALLGAANVELQQGRRECIKPDLHAKFKLLCSVSEQPDPNWLFGSDLGKRVKYINETNKVGINVTGRQSRTAKPYPRGRGFLGRRPFRGRGMYSCFPQRKGNLRSDQK